jgi:hypothetical protein
VQSLFSCTLTDVPCYREGSTEVTAQQIFNVTFSISLDPDSDCYGDGMPSGWEKRYALNFWKNDAHLDLDGDSYGNLAEYRAGTNPNDKTSFPTTLKSVVTIEDVIMALQAVIGAPPPDIGTRGDVNGDGVIGMEDVIYMLQVTAGLRAP